MSRSLIKSSQSLKPPKGLTQFFANPPLALNEKREEYEDLFDAIAAAAKPADAIAWLLVRDFTDLTWQIQREKNLIRKLMEIAEERAVADMLTPDKLDWTQGLDDDDVSLIPGRGEALDTASDWAKNPEARIEINKRLADQGYDATDILNKALCPGSQFKKLDAFDMHADLDRFALRIEKADRRIAAYEQRRYTLLREIERYSDKLARRVEAVPSEIIEGQFTEAAE
jgi:hypothetical protein